MEDKNKEIMKKNFIQAIDNITKRYYGANTRYFGYDKNGTPIESAKVKVYDVELEAINSYIVQVLGR